MNGWARVLPWVFIGALALGLRLYGLRFGLPAVYNPDEVAIMARALAFAKGDLNPHNFLYPSFYFYVLFAWEGLTAVLAVATRAVDSLAGFQREFFLDPTRVFVAGRLLTALLGTATVIALGILGGRIRAPLAGPIAAVLLAIAPLHVLNSHYVKHDVPVTLLIVLAYLAYDRLWALSPDVGSQTNLSSSPGGTGRPPSREALRRARRGAAGSQTEIQPAAVPPGRFGAIGEGSSVTQSRGFGLEAPLFVAAAITGAAFSTHYYTIFLAIPLAWSAARGARSRTDAVRRIAIAAGVSAFVFFLLSPFLLAEPGTALRDIRANREIVVDRAAGELGYAAGLARYAQMLLLDTVGLPSALLALAGIGVAARRDPRRTLWLLAFPLPFVLFIASTYPATRYLVPLAPFMTLFAAIALAELWRQTRFGNIGYILLIAAFVAATAESVRLGNFIRQTDTRTLAREFIEARVPAGTTILSQPYSVPLESTPEALREAVTRSGGATPTKTRLQLERAPYPAPAYRVLLMGRGLDADKLYVGVDQLGGSDPLAALRREHVAFVVLKRYNDPDPATLPFLAALAREGRQIAVFSPYRAAGGSESGRRAEPFLHNTDARIVAALERPGPVVEIWQIDGPGS